MLYSKFEIGFVTPRSYFLVWPSSTSFWNALHWAQLYNEPEPQLRAFNYGPEYDLGRVKAPTVLLAGGSDVLAPPQSFDEAKKHLKESLVETHQIRDYSHMASQRGLYWVHGSALEIDCCFYGR